MPEQGDKKIYIGDIWANADKAEYQKKFIEDVLEVHQHHGFGFDADMLDGFHATDFATAQQGELAETALQPFYLGETLIENTFAHHYITTEAIELLERTLTNIPWKKWDNTDEAIPDDLTEAIEFLYQLISKDINDVDLKKVDKSCVKDVTGKCVTDENGEKRMQVLSDNNFEDHHKEVIEKLEDQEFMVEVNCYNCPENHVESKKKMVLNAGTVNGLQWILITEADYATLPQTCKDNWRNMFIFVEEYPADYDSPLNCSFENGFIFRVSPDGLNIQYKNKDNDDDNAWLNLISMDSLYSAFWDKFSVQVVSTVKNVINNDNATITDTINDLIKQSTIITNMLTTAKMDTSIYNDIITNPKNYAFLPSTLMDDYVYQAYYYENGDTTSPKKYLQTNTFDQNNYTFKELSMNDLVKDYINKINNVDSKLPDDLKSSYNTLLNTTIPDLTSRITAIEGKNIDGIRTELNGVVAKLGNPNDASVFYNGSLTAFSRIKALESRVSVLEEKENTRNLLHVFVGRWSTKSNHDADVTTNISKIEMNVFDEGVAAINGESDSNPNGIYVRINNKLAPQGNLAFSDILDEARIHLTIQGMSNNCSHRFAEYWCAFYNDTNQARFADKYKRINGAQQNSNYQFHYSTGKIPIRWVDVTTKGEKATYLITATPYYKGQICGNIVQIPLYIVKP